MILSQNQLREDDTPFASPTSKPQRSAVQETRPA
jgi:hypothetical protein